MNLNTNLIISKKFKESSENIETMANQLLEIINQSSSIDKGIKGGLSDLIQSRLE